MNRPEKIVMIAVGVLTSSLMAHVNGAAPSLNPYGPISDRNVFGLRQPPSAMRPLPARPKETPFKIYCSGLTSILGRWQVLFSVSSNKPEMSYILSEGQEQDGVKVMHIDPGACLIVFNNHGVVQQIHLAEKPKADPPRRFQTPSQILFQLEHPNGT